MSTTVAHMAPFALGVLGNMISIFVYLSPLPTFYRIYQRKSTESFQFIPYSVALFSAMLMLYYATLKSNDRIMLITINSAGMSIEATYLLVYMKYAPKPAKIFMAKLLLIFNAGAYGGIILLTYFLWEGHRRTEIVGWVSATFNVCVFVAPLSIMRLVIKTRSVEYMPFLLSFFLTICGLIWFLYGLGIKDYFLAVPNGLGFCLGVTQMILYATYKNAKKVLPPDMLQELLLDDEAETMPESSAAGGETVKPSGESNLCEPRVRLS